MTLDNQILASREQIMEFIQNFPKNEPVVMVNILKFKEKTNNGDETGRAAYLKYSQNMEPLLAKAKARVIWAGNIQNTVIGDSGDQPDMVLLVEYPSVQHFVDMALSEAYKEIGKDREIALQYGGLWASKTINM